MPTSIALTLRLDSTIRAIPIAIDGISGVVSPYDPTTVIVSPSTLQEQCQPTINAFDGSQQAQDAWTALQKQNAAIEFMTDLDEYSRSYRAVAAVLVSEINILREWIVSFQAAVASATTLANLKTGIAALPNLPDRTLSQAKTAFISNVNQGV